MDLYDQPNGVRVVGHLRAGERVTGLTGEVHSVPIRVVAKETILDPEHFDRTMIPRGASLLDHSLLGRGPLAGVVSRQRNHRGKHVGRRPLSASYLVGSGEDGEGRDRLDDLTE